MGYRDQISLGAYPIKEYVYFLKEFYDEFQKYEIEIVDGIDFKAAKYFDITTNNWKLDKLVPSKLIINGPIRFWFMLIKIPQLDSR